MKYSKTQEGFTLIEVLVAIAILSIGILALITMQTTSIKGNATSNRISEATALGADEIEQLFIKDYTDDPILDDADGDGLAGLDDTECCYVDGKNPAGVTVVGCTAKADSCLLKDDYFVYINIAIGQPLSNAELKASKTIRVIVNRPDNEGNIKTVSFNYFRTQDI